MSQAGYTPIQLYYSTTAAATPSAGNLANGEVALNITDGKLFYKDNGGVVRVLATAAGSAGDVVGPGSSTDNALVRFDTTTGKLVQNSVAVLSDTGDLTGVAAVTMSGALTLSGGTANGVAYLNGSKVLTTGSALTFDGTGLSVTGSTSATLKLNGRSSDNASSANFYDNTGATRYGFFYFDPSNAQIATTNATPLAFLINSSEQMRLTSTGLGIGTSSPFGAATRRALVVRGNANGAEINIQSTTATDGTSDGFALIAAGSDAYVYNRISGGFMAFGTSNTERARIDSFGNLLVGTTAIGNQNADCFSFTKASGYIAINHVNGKVSGSGYATFGYNAGEIGSITQNGTTSVLYNITSDQRLKENIQDAASASALIDSLQVRQYEWKSDGSHQRYGFIAQELVTVVPEAVHQPINPDDMMAVDYSKLVPMLVKEIQSLRQRLAAAGI